MSTGSWKIEINKNMPQKVATAMADLQLIGVEYTPIAYLGSQQVNGINHAVLAEQLVLTGKDTKNIVVLKFNEKPNEDKLTLVGVITVVETGSEFGGIRVDAQTDIPSAAKEAFDLCFEGLVGAHLTPFAYLGEQTTKGVDYIIATEVKSVTLDPVPKFVIFVVNSMTRTIKQFEPLSDRTTTQGLGYAFTW